MTPKPKKSAPISLRTYARKRGVSVSAVSKAIDSGRLVESVVMVGGAPKIRDAELAGREWKARTRPRIDDRAAPSADYFEARARHEAAEAALAEIELAERRAELVLAKDVESRLVNVFSSCKTKLLGVPGRARQRDPALTGQQIDLFEDLIREALEDLANGEYEP